MGRDRQLGVWGLALVAALGCRDEDEGNSLCDADGLAAALAAAGPGDTVQMGSCTITGTFTVPPGVTLAGSEGSVIAADGDVAVRLEPSPDTPTTLRDLSVQSALRVGVLARGAGGVAVQRVAVVAERGYALGAESLTSIALESVDLAGPVTADNADSETFVTPDPDVAATFGLVLLGVARADLSDVDVSGFAEFGVTVLDRDSTGATVPPTTLTWTQGTVVDTLGTATYFSGGSIELTDVTVMRTHRGLRGLPTYGAVFTGEAAVTSTRLSVCDGSDFGILHEGGTGDHTDLEVTHNGSGGLMAGATQMLRISGPGSSLYANGAVNVLVLDARDVMMRDAQIGGALLKASNLRAGTLGDTIDLGDGIQLLGTYENVILEDVTLTDNERAGLVVDVGMDGGAGITFTNVSVNGSGSMLGAIGGTVDAPSGQLVPAAVGGGWDTGISRLGATAANDGAWAGNLDIAGIIGPSMISRPDGATSIIGPSM